MDRIMQNRLDRGFKKFQHEYEEKAIEVLRSGWYVLGNELKDFEEEFAAYVGAKYCVGLASGLDALWIAFRVLGIGPGDEVIVQGNTYIASVMGITINGATPVFVEPDEYHNIDADKIESFITPKTKAILVVHLYGQASNMSLILEIVHRHGLRLIEDCAQSHGAYFDGRMTGTFGNIGCFSFYPSKNLGAFGDSGAIVTDNAEINEAARIFRNYGSEKRYYNKVVGANSRLDEIQAGLLRVRLRHLNEINAEHVEMAKRYLYGIRNEKIQLPKVRNGATSVWHQFVLHTSERSSLINFLEKNNIGSIIHYPIPPHLSEAYKFLGYRKGDLPITERYSDEVLSLPMYVGMTRDEQNYIIETINKW